MLPSVLHRLVLARLYACWVKFVVRQFWQAFVEKLIEPNARIKDEWLYEQVEPLDRAGPSALVCGPPGEESLARAVALVERYVRPPAPGHPVRWRTTEGIRERASESNLSTHRPPIAL